jgi:hypothetical protein
MLACVLACGGRDLDQASNEEVSMNPIEPLLDPTEGRSLRRGAAAQGIIITILAIVGLIVLLQYVF